MSFKDRNISEIPAVNEVQKRAQHFSPALRLLKSGYEFDDGTYRFYFTNEDRDQIRIDVGENLLKDIAENPSSSESNYTGELLSRLDEVVLGSLRKCRSFRNLRTKRVPD